MRRHGRSPEPVRDSDHPLAGARPSRTSHPKSDPRLLPALAALVDKLRRGILMIDEHGHVLYRNPAADGILAAGTDVLRIVDERLEIGSPEVNERVAAYLAQVRERPDSVGRALALRVDGGSGEAAYRTLLSLLDMPSRGAAQRLLSVIVYRSQPMRTIPKQVLTELYGLTRAEAALVGELYAGRSLTDAARAIGITPNTARTHLKRIFGKCEVRSQAELLQLLALGPNVL